MSNLFGVDIQGIVATALGEQLFDSTLTKKTAGAYDVNDPTAGTSPTSTSYTCKGAAIKVVSMFLDGDQRRRKFKGQVMILLGTLTAGIVPASGDVVTTVDPRTKLTVTGTITKVDVDPAGAQATCEVIA